MVKKLLLTLQKSRIEQLLSRLHDERATRLEAASINREALRSQISRIRETVTRILNDDTTLAERLRTLFREQGLLLHHFSPLWVLLSQLLC